MKKLTYISVATIPSKTAHANYIIQLADAFITANYKFDLIACANQKKPFNKEQIRSFYDMRSSLNISVWTVWSYSSFTRIITLAVKTFFARLDKQNLYLTHNPVIAAVLKLKKLPFIYDVHGVGKRERILNFATRSKCCMGIIFNSSGSLKFLLPLLRRKDIPYIISPPAIKLHSNNYSSPLEKAKIKEDLNIPLGHKVLTYVGSLRKDRGIITVLKAFKKCRENHKDIFLQIVGGTDNEILAYTKFAEQFVIDKSCFSFVGFVSQKELPKYYLASDFLIASYTSEVSTINIMSPLKILEYLQYGYPIIAPDFPRILDWLKHMKNGFLYNPDSEESLVQTILEAISSPPQIIEKIKLNNLHATNKNTWDKKIIILSSWIKDLVS